MVATTGPVPPVKAAGRGPGDGEPGQHRVTEQRAELIPGQCPPAAGAGHHDRQPVGVRVVGQDQVGALSFGGLPGQVKHARRLRVGVRHGREGGVGPPLGGHANRRGPAGYGEHLAQRDVPDAVQRGVHDLEVGRPWRPAAARRHRRHVAVGGIVRPRAVERPLGPARGQRERVDRVDEGGDLLIGRRQQLAAVTHVDLDPVVLARVVAGRHHQPVGRVFIPHGEGEHRGRQRPGQHRDPDARAGQDPGGVGGEHLRVGAAVVADHDAGSVLSPGPSAGRA